MSEKNWAWDWDLIFFCFFYRLRAYVVHFAIELYITTEIILFLNLLWEMNAKFLEMAIV